MVYLDVKLVMNRLSGILHPSIVWWPINCCIQSTYFQKHPNCLCLCSGLYNTHQILAKTTCVVGWTYYLGSLLSMHFNNSSFNDIRTYYQLYWYISIYTIIHHLFKEFMVNLCQSTKKYPPFPIYGYFPWAAKNPKDESTYPSGKLT